MICFEPAAGTITLQTRRSTYQMKIDDHGVLLHTYYGKKVKHGDMSSLIRLEDRGFTLNPPDSKNDRSYSLNTLPQEYTSCGVSDLRLSSLEIESDTTGCTAEFRYISHRTEPGKYALPGLPAFYGGADDAQTLIVTLRDDSLDAELDLLYGVFEAEDLITRAAVLRNTGENPLRLKKLMSFNLDLPDADYHFISFRSAYAREREYVRTPIRPGRQTISSLSGLSSTQHTPFAVFCRPGTTEDLGECIGMALVYSGSFELTAEQSIYDETRITMGINPFHFCFTLEKGDTFTTPEAALVYSENGLGDMSHHFHHMIQQNLCRGPWKNRRRPLLINTWEATEFHFNAEKIVSIAERAAQAGIEMIVLDDGWFGHRYNDEGGMGDWYVNEEKLPGGLAPLVERIHALNMRFGLWIEPESISEDSSLFQAHPDWVLRTPGRSPSYGRSQLVLDLVQPDVREYIRTSIDTLLASTDIDYLKWDMNRCMSDVWSNALPPERQGETFHRYILGLYELLEWLNQTYPDILIEGCCAGGARFDCGMLYYTPQIWCSDNTDAIDRLRIQYGTSFCYPASAIGAHVSDVPNGGTGRSAPMFTRGVVAMCGTFGFELDPNKLDENDLASLRSLIDDYKKYTGLVFSGEYYRLTNPFDAVEYVANMFVAPDRSRALVNIVQKTTYGGAARRVLHLRGLDPTAAYRLDSGQILYGDQLMNAGIRCPALREFEAARIYLERVTAS